MRYILLICLCFVLGACGTTDSQLQSEGRSLSYIDGFHDGRHSGMAEEGNAFEHFIRDHDRFDNDDQYSYGWIAGESEGKRIQDQAAAIGDAAGGVYQGIQIGHEVDRQTDFGRIAEDAVRGADTPGLGTLNTPR